MKTEANKKIGLLDSGVGGLSVLAQVIKELPLSDYIYFGDTKNLPYGEKTKEQVLSYTGEILSFFYKKNVTDVVIACNTTSAVAYDELKEIFKDKLNIIPLIQSIAPYVLKGLKDDDKIAILATDATIKSKKYETEIKKYYPDAKILALSCPGFVEIVENRLYEDKKAIELIKQKLDLVRDFGAKRVVLGCTHYPYLVDIFKKMLDVDYFNPALCVAQIAKTKIKASGGGKVEFFVSKNPDEFILSAKTFFDVQKAELVNF